MAIPIRTRTMWKEHRSYTTRIQAAFEEAEYAASIAYKRYRASMPVTGSAGTAQCFVEVLMGTPDPKLRTYLENRARPVKLGWYVLTQFNRSGSVHFLMAHRRAAVAAQKVLEKHFGDEAMFRIASSGRAYRNAKEPSIERARHALHDISSTYGMFFGMTGAPIPIETNQSYLSTLWHKEAA
jgi:hypothetical protein